MALDIQTTQIELTPAIREYVTKRMESLVKILDVHDPNVYMVVSVGLDRTGQKSGDDLFHAEARITSAKDQQYFEVKKDDLYAAIDVLRDDIFRAITRKKKKERTRLRKGGSIIKRLVRRLSGK